MKEKTQNLMGGLLDELNRARELLKQYQELPSNAGWFGIGIINKAIKAGEDSIRENDVVKMLVAYKELKSLE